MHLVCLIVGFYPCTQALPPIWPGCLRNCHALVYQGPSVLFIGRRPINPEFNISLWSPCMTSPVGSLGCPFSGVAGRGPIPKDGLPLWEVGTTCISWSLITHSVGIAGVSVKPSIRFPAQRLVWLSINFVPSDPAPCRPSHFCAQETPRCPFAFNPCFSHTQFPQ